MEFDPKIHQRRSIRLKGYDYTQPGAYFVTLVTSRRQEILGEVVSSLMRIGELGKIIEDEWMKTAQLRPNIELHQDEFVIMPNHIHGIIWIVDDIPVGADRVRPVADNLNPVRPKEIKPSSIQQLNRIDAGIHNQGACNAPLRNSGNAGRLRRVAGSLSSIIAGYKASVTSRARRELNITHIWQRNYYEHIIRSEAELQKIRDTIDTNPLHWHEDRLHPTAPPNQLNKENPTYG